MACNTDYTPKPKAFIKLDFPEKVYEKLDSDCPFIFELPVYSQLLKKENICFIYDKVCNANGVYFICL